MREVIQKLFRTTEYKEYPPNKNDDIRVETHDIEALVRSITEGDYPASQHLGVVPAVQLYFIWLASGPDHDRGYEQLIRLTVDYLSQTQDDLVLLFQRALPLLLRRKGELTLNSYEGL